MTVLEFDAIAECAADHWLRDMFRVLGIISGLKEYGDIDRQRLQPGEGSEFVRS